MEQISDSEFNALISLLDDPDEEIILHVSNKLKELGIKGVEKLEFAWETASDALQQSRIEDLIKEIQFDKLKNEFVSWKEKDANDLLLGAILVAKYRYPDLDESVIYATIDKLVQTIWIELNNGLTPLEEIHVFNNVFYKLTGFIGEQEGFTEPDLGYINKVLEAKKGSSNALGILYIILCKELNLPVYGIDLPYYFVLAYASGFYDRSIANKIERKDISFYINPVNEGLVFQHKQINDYLKQMNVKASRRHFLPCDNIQTIAALVKNLILCYEQKKSMEDVEHLKEIYYLLQNR